MTDFLRLIVVLGVCTLSANVAALPTTINFDGFADSTLLTNEVPGLVFSNAVVLSAGVSLNETEFPPRSAPNVISDFGGPLTIDFSSPVTSLLAYLTYIAPVTLRIYDAASTEVGSITSLFSSNIASSGDPGSTPNEPLAAIFASGFMRAVFTGEAAGGSFTLDDLTYEPLRSVPEPSSLALGLVALTALLLRRPAARR